MTQTGFWRTAAWPEAATTNAYAVLPLTGGLATWDVRLSKTKEIIITNTHAANGAHVKVEASLDLGATWPLELLAETLLAATEQAEVSLAGPYSNVRILVKSALLNTAAKVRAEATAQGN